MVAWTTPELAPPLLTKTPTGGRFSSRDLTCIAALHGGSLVVLGSNAYMPAMVGCLNHWATAALDDNYD
ncbi:hypothetical protein TNCV_1018591 [Trichonephila clavipes]|nr:hypothetical protein TNCV_1018591 [Trichonephila clavipes]